MNFIARLIERVFKKDKTIKIDLKDYDDNHVEIDHAIEEKLLELKVFNDRLIKDEVLSAYVDQEMEESSLRVDSLLERVDDIDFCSSISEVIKFIRLSAIFRVVCEKFIQKKEIQELKKYHADARLILIHAALKYGALKESSILWDGIGFVFTEGMTEEDKVYVGLVNFLMRTNSHVNEPTSGYSYNLKLLLSKLRFPRLYKLSESQYLFQ